MTAFTSTTIAESSLTTFYNRDTISDTALNGNFNALKNRVNTLISEVASYAANLSTTNTWTANQTYNANIAMSQGYISFGAGYGFSDTFILIDADNTGAGANCSVRFERGTDNSADAQLIWNASATDASTYFSFTTDGTTLCEVRGKSPTNSASFATKGYADALVVTNQGIYQQTTQPTIAANALWIDTTDANRPTWQRSTASAFVSLQPVRFIDKVVTLTDGATPALDASLGNIFVLTAAGNRTIAIPTNAVAGQKIIIKHIASGGVRTLALNTGAGGFRFGSDVTGLSFTGSGKSDYIGAIYNGEDSYWDVVAYVKGY